MDEWVDEWVDELADKRMANWSDEWFDKKNMKNEGRVNVEATREWDGDNVGCNLRNSISKKKMTRRKSDGDGWETGFGLVVICRLVMVMASSKPTALLHHPLNYLSSLFEPQPTSNAERLWSAGLPITSSTRQSSPTHFGDNDRGFFIC